MVLWHHVCHRVGRGVERCVVCRWWIAVTWTRWPLRTLQWCLGLTWCGRTTLRWVCLLSDQSTCSPSFSWPTRMRSSSSEAQNARSSQGSEYYYIYFCTLHCCVSRHRHTAKDQDTRTNLLHLPIPFLSASSNTCLSQVMEIVEVEDNSREGQRSERYPICLVLLWSSQNQGRSANVLVATTSPGLPLCKTVWYFHNFCTKYPWTLW